MKKAIVFAGSIVAFAVAQVAGAADMKSGATKEAQIKLGEHLVKSIGCADCHSPKIMGPNGPEPDPSRFLAGHPAEEKMPPAPAAMGPWMIAAAGDLTTWSGPWGTSFSRNLTPDKETGLGDWTAENFIDTIRSGRRLGKGRALLPPMPWQPFSSLTDDELKAIFAYLQSIPAIKNPVPEPIPPAAPGQPQN
jgi:mono/diheme cytochrome c family protein